MNKFLLSALSLGLLASCSTTNYTYRSSDIADNSIIASQVVVDTKLDMSNKIEVVSSKRNTVQEAIDEAYYKAIAENRVDVVVSPIFEITTTDKVLFWGGKSTAKLTGFGARYENARSKINAIKELKGIDTTDVKKFMAIYENGNGSSSRGNINNHKKSGLASLPIIGSLFN
ncbi:MAG TPA: hypothetical protein VK927_05520 [Adhaeribacter sp.]|nr:hypothetical protein [Adhaeribacter sp.]